MEKFKVFVWQILLVISKEEQEKKQEQKKEEDEKKYDNNNFMRVGTFSVMIVFFFCEFNETLQNGCHISVRGL